MPPITRRIVPIVRGLTSSLRSVATLAEGQTLKGKKWDYQIVEPIKGDATHNSAVFKARVVPTNASTCGPTWAVIKTALPDDKNGKKNLIREYDTYCLPEVARSPHFRELYDRIENPHTETTPFLALEWLDSTLRDVEYADVMLNYSFMKALIDTMLSSCDALDRHDRINTDIKPVNILLSNVGSGHPTVKMADLGVVYTSGTHVEIQPFAMRAPEVYEGRRGVSRSQIWACAATLLCWMKPGILGVFGNPFSFTEEAWSIAKIRRLFPDWSPSPVVDKPVEQANFRAAQDFIELLPPDLEKISPLDDELQTITMLPEVRDLIRYLFVPDVKERPSAAEALASEPFKALAEKARLSSEQVAGMNEVIYRSGRQ
ncbi:kinase-like domain-containing protein [Xylariomycetidae sp. FL2044]|nr:kinase-like domain-containing protein [Xylariomycetidae sp. FL2044]